MNPKVFSALSYGVYIVSTMDGDRPTGCIANSIMQITSSPASVAVSMNHDNYTHSCIVRNGYFAISILSEQATHKLIGTFGFRCGRDIDKFANIDYRIEGGLPVLSDSCGYILCRVKETMETSTHTVFLGEVIDGDLLSDAVPMTYAYYHTVIKGKSPKTAPTYIPDPPKNRKYVCDVCGYIYEGTSLPADYVCPMCGVDASHFQKS